MDIERQQTQALKHIFGPKISARKLRELAGVKSLEERRKDAALKFAIKARSSERFGSWFPERPPSKRGRRLLVGHRRYEESTFRTDRHLNSPKNYLRRLLNEHEDERSEYTTEQNNDKL